MSGDQLEAFMKLLQAHLTSLTVSPVRPGAFLKVLPFPFVVPVTCLRRCSLLAQWRLFVSFV